MHMCVHMHTYICICLLLHLSIYWKPWVHTSTSSFSLILHGSFKFHFFSYLWLYSLTMRKNKLPVNYLIKSISFCCCHHPIQAMTTFTRYLFPTRTFLNLLDYIFPHRPLLHFFQCQPSCPQLNYSEREEKEKPFLKNVFPHIVCVSVYILCAYLPVAPYLLASRVLTGFALYMRARKDPS